MKKLLNLAIHALVLTGALWLGACQEEFEEVKTSGIDSTSFTATSEMAVLIGNTASFDGSFDNIVDGASCFALKFPYTVIANGNEIDIKSRDDLQVIEYFFDLSLEDDDVLAISYPITIIRTNYAEVVLNDEEELAAFVDGCAEGDMDDDIECIDFVYPITLFTFDLFNTQTGSVTVESDEQLFRFFHKFGENNLVSIDYPVTLSYSYDTGTTQVASNEELATALRLAKDSCDEDDDNNYNDDDFGNSAEELGPFLTGCSWRVHSIELDGVDLTSHFETYTLNFIGGTYDGNGPDPYLQVFTATEGTINGEWAVGQNDKGEATLAFGLDGMPAFNGVWSVFKGGTWGVWDLLVLYRGEGNRIVLIKGCYGFDGLSSVDLAQILRECSWVIGNDFNQGEESRSLLGYELEFEDGNVVTLSNSSSTLSGTWEVIERTWGELVLAITLADEPMLSFQWSLRIREDHQLLFAGPEAEFGLQLLRTCVQNGKIPDESEYLETVRATLENGDWRVASYKVGDLDLTGGFEGYLLSYDSGGALTVSNNTEPVKEGLWRVMVDASDFIYRQVYINLGVEDDLFAELTAVWTLEEYMENSFTENRIVLYWYGTDHTRIELVLEK